MTPPEKNNSFRDLIFLDGLRGFAAFYVMVSHARWFLWEGYSKGYVLHPETYSAFERILVYIFACFRFGYEAVIFFFVLSGFVIHLRYSRDLKHRKNNSEFDFFNYLKRRARRLYPPLVSAMIITWIADSLGPDPHTPILQNFENYMQTSYLMNPSHSLLTAIGNLAFTMNSYVPVWGSNGALWSLRYEWWFYMFYPLIWYFSKKSVMLPNIVMVLMFILIPKEIAGPLGLFTDALSLMLIWWLGAILADVYTGRIKISFFWLSSLIAVLPLLFLLGESKYKSLLCGIFFAGVISACFSLQKLNIKLKPLESAKWMGDMSYSLYVIHFPVLFLLSRYLAVKNGQDPALPSGFSWLFAGIILTVVLSYVTHLFTEKPFISKKNYRKN